MKRIREALESDLRLERYETIQTRLVHSDKRDYPCIEVDSLARDKSPPAAGGTGTPLLLQMAALYCLHPDPSHGNAAFAIIYSHRGPSAHPGFREEAWGIIDGVRVPGIHP